MGNWTIAQRIIAGGATMIALFTVVAATAVLSLRHIEQETVAIKEDSIPGLN